MQPSRLVAGLVHTAAILAARLLPPALSFALTAAIARGLGPERLGAFVYAAALLLLAQTAAGGGLSLQLTRELAARPERARALVRQATSFAWACAVVAGLALALHARVSLDGAARTATLLFALAVLPSGEMAVQEGIFLGRLAYHRVTLVAAVDNGLKLLLAGAALAAGGGIAAVCAMVVVARWVAYAYGRRLASATLGTEGTAEPLAAGSWLAFAREALPWALLFTGAMAFLRIDLIAVEAMLGGPAVGLYGAAVTVIMVLLIVPNSANTALFPRLAAAFSGPRDIFARQSRLAILGMAAVAVPPALLVTVFAEPVLTLLYGPQYRESAPALRVLAAALPLHAVNLIAGSVLQAAGRLGAMVRALVIALVTQVALALVLVPRFGLEGAAGALVGATAVGLLAVFVGLWPLIGLPWPLRRPTAVPRDRVPPVATPS